MFRLVEIGTFGLLRTSVRRAQNRAMKQRTIREIIRQLVNGQQWCKRHEHLHTDRHCTYCLLERVTGEIRTIPQIMNGRL